MSPPDNAGGGPDESPPRTAFTTDEQIVRQPSGPWPLKHCLVDCARMLAELQAQRHRLLGDLETRERDMQQAYARGSADKEAAVRQAYQAGRANGRAEAEREMQHAWAQVARQVRALGRPSSPSHAELEARRWGGRREDFGKPRPGDFLGRERSGQEVA